MILKSLGIGTCLISTGSNIEVQISITIRVKQKQTHVVTNLCKRIGSQQGFLNKLSILLLEKNSCTVITRTSYDQIFKTIAVNITYCKCRSVIRQFMRK